VIKCQLNMQKIRYPTLFSLCFLALVRTSFGEAVTKTDINVDANLKEIVRQSIDVFGRRFKTQLEQAKNNATSILNDHDAVRKHYTDFALDLRDVTNDLFKNTMPFIVQLMHKLDVSNECSASLLHLLQGIRYQKLWALKGTCLL